MKRVVVTGVGMISPLGTSVTESWSRILDCESGIKKIVSFDVSDLSSQIAGQVPSFDVLQTSSTLFDPLNYVSSKDLSRLDKFIIYAIAAATEAMHDAGFDSSLSDEDKERFGVIIGSGIGGLSAIHSTSIKLNEQGARRVSPFFIPSSLINLASGHVSIRYGLKGPNHAVVTACASGTHAIADAARLIKTGEADIMIAGGTEAAVCRLGVAGFAAARALSTHKNDTPEEASRPWDKDRDGFVIAEGSGLIILEELEHAQKRGAKIYGEVVGYGMSGDAYHITAPCPDGNGACRAMKNALISAKINPEQIDYINAHGTSTPAGDVGELRAVEQILGSNSKAFMSSTKSSIGHLLGAAGAVEAIFTLLAIRDQVAPATLNLHESEETFLDLVPLQPKQKRIEYALSNSFGFGGTNASLVFKKF
ncbi:MAG: beta-ketoacyl-[acyl-carrier-protein] synthase II [Alphaproteobacteria bacterium]|nr:beta-ketoacyl-[acyl-carrier-protein] synthase II [Alphaproteobacteria bacterium]